MSEPWRSVHYEVYARHETSEDWEWYAEADRENDAKHYAAGVLDEPGMEVRVVRVTRDLIEEAP